MQEICVEGVQTWKSTMDSFPMASFFSIRYSKVHFAQCRIAVIVIAADADADVFQCKVYAAIRLSLSTPICNLTCFQSATLNKVCLGNVRS